MGRIYSLNVFFEGTLIGLAALILMFVNGRVMGVSGILNKLISPASSFEFAWRITFIVGIILVSAIEGCRSLKGQDPVGDYPFSLFWHHFPFLTDFF